MKYLAVTVILINFIFAVAQAEEQKCAIQAESASESLMKLNHEDADLPTDLSFIGNFDGKYVWESYKYMEVAPGVKRPHSNTYRLTFVTRPSFMGGGCDLAMFEMLAPKLR